MSDPDREDLLARVSDLLRRSGVEDAEELIRRLELNLPRVLRLRALVRTDGVYRSERFAAADAWYYARFFPDGTVITVTTSGKPMEIRGWFHPAHDDISKGTYTVSAGVVRFSSTSSYGTVDYEGVLLDGDRIRLRWHSLINQNRGEETYLFMPDEPGV